MGMGKALKKLAVSAAAGAVLAGTAIVGGNAAAPAVADAADRDVVFVFAGLIGPGDAYEPLNTNLRNAGFEVRTLWLPGFDHRAEAAQLKSAVDAVKKANPNRTVNTLTHSSGAITNRYYLKALGGAADIARTVVFGGVEYGSPTGCYLPSPANAACPDSSLLREINAGLDTPGPTEYYSVSSTSDPLSGNLDGRQCRMEVEGILPPEASFDHAYTAWDPRVFPLAINALRGNCSGTWVDSPEGSITYENSVDASFLE